MDRRTKLAFIAIYAVAAATGFFASQSPWASPTESDMAVSAEHGSGDFVDGASSK